MHLLQEGDGPGNDVAVLIAPSHMTPIHSIENAADGRVPSFCVCLYPCLRVCV